MKYILAVLLSVGIISAGYAGGFMLLHVGDSNGNGGSGPLANALLSQTGVCIEAQAGSCIMVQ